ncbi:ABC transporter substrate-binding protein [Halostagnicola sp. A56]|uniref:ABC transporter substrate-binding protein n=1 Tax=Halostagnicola sp. A56 TaxID=1495067 RepID=UPI0004A1382A|nr:ABC transporter substrate-binding protein [Halostagnicola sp. A56]KDE57605.1 ABC transporter substrate-binding protein [Halostagnicola sp. A56]
MANGNNHQYGCPSRRDILAYGAAGGFTAVAGCLSGGSNTDRFRMLDAETGGAPMSRRHCNPWNLQRRGAWHPGALVYDRPVAYSPVADESFPLVATDWEMVDDTTLEVTFSDEWTWHDGDQVVADDWVMQLQIALAMLEFQAEDGARPHQFLESAEAVDDRTARVSLYEPLRTPYAIQTAVSDLVGDESRGIFTKHTDDQWADWHRRLQDAEGEQRGAVVEEITTTNYPALEDVIGNGPFEVADVGDTVAVFERFDDHPNADALNFSECSMRIFDVENPVQPYANDEVDAAHIEFPVADDSKGQLPEEHTLVREDLSTNLLFAFNCGHDIDFETPFDSANVRKAVCHVFDRQQVTQLLEGVNRLFDWPPSRVPGPALADGSHDAVEWVQDFTKYGRNDTERAAELLEREGFERDDGAWYTPDGGRFEVDVMNGADRKDIGVLKQNLEDFGIAVEQEQVDPATFDERRHAGEYHLMPDISSANGVTAMWGLDLVPRWLQSIVHFDLEAEIPMPVGDPEGESGTKTINVEEHIRQWQVTGEDQYHRELLWWWNQHVPQMEAMFQPDAGAYNGTDWTLEGPDGIVDGVDDALYLVPKMDEATIEYTG